jgi:hypothetical protein
VSKGRDAVPVGSVLPVSATTGGQATVHRCDRVSGSGLLHKCLGLMSAQTIGRRL